MPLPILFPHSLSQWAGACGQGRAARLARVGVQTLSITPGSPWKNGYIESVNRRLRAERLDRELFATLWEVKVLVERWRPTTGFVRTVRWAIDHPHRRPSRHNGPDSHGG